MIFFISYLLSILVIEWFFAKVTELHGDLGEYEGLSFRTAILVVEVIPILNTVIAVIFIQSLFRNKY
jgi:hypothetical protein